MAKKIDIGGELHSVATDHKVTDASEIKDISKGNKSQADFNNDVDRHEVEIHGTGGIDSRLTDVEQMEQIVIDGGDAQIATGADFTNPDATKRAKVPTVGAIVDGLNDGIYDVSKRNPTGGPNSDGKFTLEYILSNANTLIPTSWRHGGMSISFVSSYDNKYVQYRLMATSFSTTPSDWQGVDDEPTAGSNNLVKSGGVYTLQQEIGYFTCNSHSTTEEKVVTASGYTLNKGGAIKILFLNKNNANNPTLNINSQGAKPIIYNGEIASSSNAWAANEVVEFYYDPTYDNNTGAFVGRSYLAFKTLLGLYGQALSFWWQDGGTPSFVENNDNSLTITFPNTLFVRVINNYVGKKIYQGIPSTLEYTLTICQALKFNTDSNSFSVINLGTATPTALDPQKDCIVLYNYKGNYGGALLPYIEKWRETLNLEKHSIMSADISNLDSAVFGELNLFSGLTFYQGSLYNNVKNSDSTCIYCQDYFSVEQNRLTIMNEKQLDTNYWKVRVTFCDGNQTFVSQTAYTFVDGKWNVNVPANAKYVRFSIQLWDTSSAIDCTPASIPTDGTEILCNFSKVALEKEIKSLYNEKIETASFTANSPAYSKVIKSVSYKQGDILNLSLSSDIDSELLNNNGVYVLFEYENSGLTTVLSSQLGWNRTINLPENISSLQIKVAKVVSSATEYYLKIGVDAKINALEVDTFRLKTDVARLEEAASMDILSMYPSKKYLPLVATLKKQTPYAFSGVENTPIVFLLFTDLHGDLNNFKRIMRWKERYSDYIDDVVNAGDTVVDNVSTSYQSVIPSYIADGGDKVMLAIGNHDCCYSGSYKGWAATQDYSLQDVYDRFTGLLDSQALGITVPTSSEIGSIADYANFFYKDYVAGAVSSKPLRLFVLDSCLTVASVTASGTGNDATATQAYQNAQLSWFTAKLTEAKTLGYAVAIICHCVPACTELESDSAFTIYPTSLSIARDSQASIPIDFVNAVDSFINADGEFVCWLVGHTHANHICEITGHTEQLVIGFNTATSRSYGASQTNPYRTGYNGADPITETTDAFCLVEIDTYYKVVRLVNVGTDYDMYGRKKGMIAVNYGDNSIMRNVI